MLCRLSTNVALFVWLVTLTPSLFAAVVTAYRCVEDGTCPDATAGTAVRKDLTWDTTELAPGEIKPLTIKETGETGLLRFGHRVGLPKNMTKKILDFANRTGITEELRSRVVDGKYLDWETDIILKLGNDEPWWLRRFPSIFHSNLHFIAPAGDDSTLSLLKALGDAGFDTVLEAIGKYFGLRELQLFYISFLAVTHCNGSMYHADSYDTNGKTFNVLFPLIQVDDTPPELDILADDREDFIVPYRYEPNAAVIVGDESIHGTARTDYRGTGKFRLIVSAYMAADVTRDNVWQFVRDRMTDTDQPPYPPNWYLHFLRRNGADWKRGDPTRHLPKADQTSLFNRAAKKGRPSRPL